jgi:hypothetical protein
VSSFQAWATRNSFTLPWVCPRIVMFRTVRCSCRTIGDRSVIPRRVSSFCTIAWHIFVPGFPWRMPMKSRYVSGVDYSCWGFAIYFQLCSRCRRVRPVRMLGVVSVLVVTSRREGEHRLRVRNIYACPTRSCRRPRKPAKLDVELRNVCVATEQFLKG